MATTNLIYVPTISPPTPAPSPRPQELPLSSSSSSGSSPSSPIPPSTSSTAPLYTVPTSGSIRRQFLSTVLASCSPEELLYITTLIAPRLKRDFLAALPTELALYTLGFVESPRTLAAAARVSRRWNELSQEESVWREMCVRWGYEGPSGVDGLGGRSVDEVRSRGSRTGARERAGRTEDTDDDTLEDMEEFASFPMDPALAWLISKRREEKAHLLASLATGKGKGKEKEHRTDLLEFSYREYFKDRYITMTNWRQGGTLLRSHRIPANSAPSSSPNPTLNHNDNAASTTPTDNGVVATSLALDAEWVVIGLANSRIQVYSARTGVLAKTLVGHELGVWSVGLVSRGGWHVERDVEGTADGVQEERSEISLEDAGRKEDAGSSSGTGHAGRTRDMPRRKSERSTAGAANSSLEHLVPPSLRAAIGLDGGDEYKAASEPSGQKGSPESKRKFSDMCYSSPGWGQPNSIVVSGGCDKVVMVWDVKTGHCIYRLSGHTSTIRCIRTVPHRPLAISGARDSTLRVWNIQKGSCERVLRGHTGSVRCVSDVVGGRVVSGSYDNTCRVWDIDSGETLHVLRGHFHQIYSVAFDGNVIASGGLDTSVRVWDAESGECVALFQGHTALVCNLQLGGGLLITGGSDGRVITFDLGTMREGHKIAAHDCSVTSLQFVDDCVAPEGVGFGALGARDGLGLIEGERKSQEGVGYISRSTSTSSNASSGAMPLSRNGDGNASGLGLASQSQLQRLYQPHSASPSSSLNNDKFIITSGNDGRVRLYEVESGRYVRDVGYGGESIWRVVVGWGTCVVVVRRGGKSVVDIWSMRAGDGGGRGLGKPASN